MIYLNEKMTVKLFGLNEKMTVKLPNGTHIHTDFICNLQNVIGFLSSTLLILQLFAIERRAAPRRAALSGQACSIVQPVNCLWIYSTIAIRRPVSSLNYTKYEMV